MRQIHPYTWWENGKQRKGEGARDFPVSTDELGVARTHAPAGSQLRVTVDGGEGRSDSRNVTVLENGVTLVEFHLSIEDDAHEAAARERF